MHTPARKRSKATAARAVLLATSLSAAGVALGVVGASAAWATHPDSTTSSSSSSSSSSVAPSSSSSSSSVAPSSSSSSSSPEETTTTVAPTTKPTEATTTTTAAVTPIVQPVSGTPDPTSAAAEVEAVSVTSTAGAVAPLQAVSNDPTLPATGTNAATLLIVAAGLTALGGLLLVARGQRPSRGSTR